MSEIRAAGRLLHGQAAYVSILDQPPCPGARLPPASGLFSIAVPYFRC
jgi:hypothetical protein